MSDILELGKKHKESFGVGVRTKKPKYKTVKCSMCRREMDVREHENTPFYCYKCFEEAEVAQR